MNYYWSAYTRNVGARLVTVAGGPVVLRPVRATPCYFSIIRVSKIYIVK